MKKIISIIFVLLNLFICSIIAVYTEQRQDMVAVYSYGAQQQSTETVESLCRDSVYIDGKYIINKRR